jgi:predicted nucleotidyltransferase
VFGSYAKGTERKWSDVDVCIVSPKFTNTFKALEYLWSKREIHDPKYAIEPVGFTPEDLDDEYDSLISEIKKTGVEMDV